MSKEAGKQFIGSMSTLFSALPEDKRKVVEEVLNDEHVLEQIGKGTLLQSDYTRKTQELATEKAKTAAFHNTLENWSKEKHADLLEVVNLRTKIAELEAGGGTGNGTTNVDTSKFIDRNTLAQEIARVSGSGLELMTLIPTLTIRHFQRHGEALDAKALIEHCRTKQLSVEQGYNSFVAEKEAKLAEKELEKKIQAAREEGAREALNKAAIPYPTGPIDDSYGISALTGLGAKEGFSASDAATEFRRLVGNKQ